MLGLADVVDTAFVRMFEIEDREERLPGFSMSIVCFATVLIPDVLAIRHVVVALGVVGAKVPSIPQVLRNVANVGGNGISTAHVLRTHRRCVDTGGEDRTRGCAHGGVGKGMAMAIFFVVLIFVLSEKRLMNRGLRPKLDSFFES